MTHPLRNEAMIREFAEAADDPTKDPYREGKLTPPCIGGHRDLGTARPVEIVREPVRTVKPPEPPRQRVPVEPDEMEHRAGVESLAELQERRRLLFAPKGGNLAYLRAMYHPSGGRWDEERKKLLEALKLRACKPLPDDPPAPDKTTDKLIDAWAHAHPAYVAAVEQATRETQQYLLAELQDREITELIEDRKQRMFFASAEMRMAS